MSMSTSIQAITERDSNWDKMKAVWDACKKARVPVPDEVFEYFDYNEPSDLGPVLYEDVLGNAVERIGGEFSSRGFIVDIKKLPPEVTKIRFSNSW